MPRAGGSSHLHPTALASIPCLRVEKRREQDEQESRLSRLSRLSRVSTASRLLCVTLSAAVVSAASTSGQHGAARSPAYSATPSASVETIPRPSVAHLDLRTMERLAPESQRVDLDSTSHWLARICNCGTAL
jgi:hypothetical protein